jgi:putative N6-adenine-specific DNA methylase
MEKNKFRMVAKTFRGLEGVLAKELLEIGAKDIVVLNRAVSFTGGKDLMYRVNYYARTALSILKPVITTRIKNEVQLYNAARSVNWQDYLDSRDTLTIDSTVSSVNFNNSMFVSQKVKDAIVDQFRDAYGRRPSVNNENPVVRLNVHIANEDLTISLDSSGTSLHRRGYRIAHGQAPLNEVLAAGMIKLTEWGGNTNFVDPMFGSGTLLIEAALIAYHIPPGIFRKSFGFEKWPDFDSQLFNEVAEDNEEKKNLGLSVTGGDISKKAFESAGKNIINAMLTKKISIRQLSVDDFIPPEGGGMAIINPPYGERIKQNELNALYMRIGDALKKHFDGYDVWIISSNKEAMKRIGLRASARLTLYNGALECKYHKYEIYSGSRK